MLQRIAKQHCNQQSPPHGKYGASTALSLRSNTLNSKTVTQIKHTTKLLTHTAAVVKTITSTILDSTSATSTTLVHPTVTSTITTTVPAATTTVRARDAPAELEARGNYQQPPSYADRSCNLNQYSSACSCIGVHPATVTIPYETETVTRTSTCFETTVVHQTSVTTHLVTKTSTAISTETETGATLTATTTATVTTNPGDAIPTDIFGCAQAIDVVFYFVDTNNQQMYLNLTGDGSVVELTGASKGDDTFSQFVITASGLARDFDSPPNFALKTTDGGSLTSVFASGDFSGAVLRCTNPGQNYVPLQCQQGEKNTFYLCPAEADGSNVMFGIPGMDTDGGCQVLNLETSSPCEK